MSSKFKKLDIEKLKEKKDIKELIKALKYEDSNIRMFAAIALGEIGDERAIAPLTQSLKDKQEVQNEVLKALVRIGDPVVNTLIMAIKD
jgi:HEAT repeat protein